MSITTCRIAGMLHVFAAGCCVGHEEHVDAIILEPEDGAIVRGPVCFSWDHTLRDGRLVIVDADGRHWGRGGMNGLGYQSVDLPEGSYSWHIEGFEYLSIHCDKDIAVVDMEPYTLEVADDGVRSPVDPRWCPELNDTGVPTP